MLEKIIFIFFVLLITNCSSPMKILKEYGNSYSYSKIADSKICLCAPIVKSASIRVVDNSSLFMPDSMRDEESKEIKTSFYAQLKRAITSRSLSWQLLNDTLNNLIHTINISDSIKSFAISSELKSSLLDSKIENLILIYDIESSHEQKIYISSSGYNLNPATGVQTGISISSQTAKIDINFNYKCAILNLKNDKLVMYVKMHEHSSSPLNFYDDVCERLFNILLYNEVK